MSVIGSPEPWIDLVENMLPRLLRLVFNTWPNILGPLADHTEDNITKVLVKELDKRNRVEDLPFYIELQRVEIDPAPGQNEGRLDIAFLPCLGLGAPFRDIYFCLECKRLNVSYKGQIERGGSKYVDDGMMRFINMQYGKSVRHGAMLGYVLDGDIPSAVQNVEANIHKKCSVLRMRKPPTLFQSSVVPDIATAKESVHHRENEAVPFRVHHLFVKADKLLP